MNETKKLTGRPALLGRLWRRQSWPVIGALWIVALILAYVGFRDLALRSGRSARFFDLTYRVLQLIPMNSGDVDRAGWALDAARFLIPFLAAWTALRALLSVFRDRWLQFLLRFWRDHVIVCGLSRKGWLLAQGFAGRGDRVVVIEADESHDLIAPCRERGIVVMTGDATDPDLLCRAGVRRARHLIAVTDDDGVNAEIAVRCREVLRAATDPGQPGQAMRGGRGGGQERRGALTCTVHLVDPQLYELARTREMALEEGLPLRLELFNVFEHGARLLWGRYGPAVADSRPAPGDDGARPACSAHVLVIGLGRLGESLVVTAARDWHTRLHESPGLAAGRLRITVVDQEADWKCRALSLRYPQLAGVCDLVPLAMNVRWPEFYQGAFLGDGAGPTGEPGRGISPISVAFVCFDDDSLGLRTGLAIHQRLLLRPAGPAPVVVRVAEVGGLARLVDPEGHGPPAFVNLHTFGLLDHTCTPEAILGGTHEVLARGLHEAYRQQQAVLGYTPATNPSLAEWEALPDALRESNRAEAAGVFHYLALHGYTIAPLVDWEAASFRFPDDEVERMAESEHQRFVTERMREGWRPTRGPKDIRAKLSPALLPWAELDDAERAKTRDSVRELPGSLARAGFQIVRLPPMNELT